TNKFLNVFNLQKCQTYIKFNNKVELLNNILRKQYMNCEKITLKFNYDIISLCKTCKKCNNIKNANNQDIEMMDYIEDGNFINNHITKLYHLLDNAIPDSKYILI